MHQSAIAEAEAAEMEVSCLKLLVDKKIISNIEWEVAEANLLAARTKIEQVKIEQANTAQTNVRLELADRSLFPEKGQIQTMEGEFDKSPGSIAFRAQFPNPGELLKHGSSDNILLTNTVINAILVPQKAVFEISGQDFYVRGG